MTIFKSALMVSVLALTGVFTSAQAAEATAAPTTTARTCFWKNSARGFDVTSNNKVRVDAAGGTYELSVGACFSLRFADAIGFRTFSSQVCPNDDLLVLDFQGRVQDRCWITDIRKVR